MKTTLDIGANLVREAVRLSGERTQAAAVETALKEYARLRRKELLLSLPGDIRPEAWREPGQAEQPKRTCRAAALPPGSILDSLESFTDSLLKTYSSTLIEQPEDPPKVPA